MKGFYTIKGNSVYLTLQPNELERLAKKGNQQAQKACKELAILAKQGRGKKYKFRMIDRENKESLDMTAKGVYKEEVYHGTTTREKPSTSNLDLTPSVIIYKSRQEKMCYAKKSKEEQAKLDYEAYQFEKTRLKTSRNGSNLNEKRNYNQTPSKREIERVKRVF